MNLQESIRRILKEEKDHKKLIKSIIDSSDIYDYKYFCGVDIITPEERSDQHNYLNKDRIPYLIKVYYVGGPNSEVWPRTQAIHYKELELMEELHEYIKSLVPFNIEIWKTYVNSCDGYERLMKRKYTTDDLQESIRRILREETERKPHQINADIIQQLVDMEIEEIKEDCQDQYWDSDNNDRLVSFSTCDFLAFDPEVRVTEFLKNYSDKEVARVLIQIKVKKNTEDEGGFIMILQMRLRKWIGTNIVEVEDIYYI